MKQPRRDCLTSQSTQPSALAGDVKSGTNVIKPVIYMQINIKVIIATAAFGAAICCSCSGDNSKKEAAQWMDQARQLYGEERYEEALAAIDSLRSRCPDAIDERKQAVTLQQDIELARTERDVAALDSELQRVNAEYDEMKTAAERDKNANRATREQLTAVTLKRIERDSLQAQFDVMCAKIRYIHKQKGE